MRNGTFKETFLAGHLTGVALTLGVLLPQEGALLLVNPVLVAVLARFYFDGRKATVSQYALIAVMLLSFVVNMGFPHSARTLLRTAMLLLMFSCFPFAGGRIRNLYIYICVAVIMTSQLAYVIKAPWLISFFNTVYPYRGTLLHNTESYMYAAINTDNFMTHRLGGHFHNSNNCARVLCALLMAYLLENKHAKPLRMALPAAVILYAILLTGSRTGFVVAAAGTMFCIYTRSKLDRRWFMLLIPAAALALAVMRNDGEYRSFDISAGFDNSLAYKWNVFADYLRAQDTSLGLLFGLFDTTARSGYMTSEHLLDSEYGNLVCLYGFAGALVLASFYVEVYRGTPRGDRPFFAMLLWMVSSTLIFAYGISFVFMLLLSKYRSGGGSGGFESLSHRRTGR